MWDYVPVLLTGRNPSVCFTGAYIWGLPVFTVISKGFKVRRCSRHVAGAHKVDDRRTRLPGNALSCRCEYLLDGGPSNLFPTRYAPNSRIHRSDRIFILSLSFSRAILLASLFPCLSESMRRPRQISINPEATISNETFLFAEQAGHARPDTLEETGDS